MASVLSGLFMNSVLKTNINSRRVVVSRLFRVADADFSRNYAKDYEPIDLSKFQYDYEVTRDPEEWKFVERLFPPKVVPVPTKKEIYPSGWTPPNDEVSSKQPYFINRTKNHMFSVYLQLGARGQNKTTLVRRITGDIWRLHEDLLAHLQEKAGKKLASFVNEACGFIRIKGDHVYYTEQWMLSKGF